MSTAKSTKSKTKKVDVDPVALSRGTMPPPASGVTVRMYRHGHGDCFLLAFRGKGGKPFYMLIDCGMKKGSEVPTKGGGVLCKISDVAKDIAAATNKHLNLVVITHEHEDHVSGFLSQQEVFEQLTIDKVWLAWTDEPGFKLADDLRKKYHDVLLGLIGAAEKLRLSGSEQPNCRTHDIVSTLLDFELPGAEDRELAAAPDRIAGITNKKAIKVITDRAKKTGTGTEHLHPHTAPPTLTALPGVRFFVLGPPENEARLKDMDPTGAEVFHLAAAEERAFLAAVANAPDEAEAHQPFAPRYRIPTDELDRYPSTRDFFNVRYGPVNPSAADPELVWRRIDGDWLRSSETFALRMSNLVNNTSLVLAIELPHTKKVLLFVGDAQRGNWVSWHEKACPDGAGGEVTVTDLLGRTVFYKVGHHGSHNATMNKGGLQDMAQKKFADEFVAMIPAHQKWAEALTPPWMHPLKEIEEALRKKTKGRLFIADRVLDQPSARLLSQDEWDQFQACSNQTDLYHEFTVRDE